MSAELSDYSEREQSGIKHYALKLYLEAAVRILGASRNFKYVDCCAGPWNSKNSDYSDTSFGVAVSALNKAADELAERRKFPKLSCLLIERDATAFAELDSYSKAATNGRVSVAARQADFTEQIAGIVKYCSTPNTFPFIFIDPWGWKLAGISQITPLLRLDQGEVLINLMSPFIARFLKDNKTDFSDLLGADFPELRKLESEDLELEVVRRYCEIVKKTGKYKYVCALPVMNPDQDTFNFHLIYATRHWKGVSVFKDVERRTEKITHVVKAGVQQKRRVERSGSNELFGPEVLYTERRYKKLAERNQGLARTAIWTKIQVEGDVSYDDCWAEALQMSTVYESHLRGWLGEWERESKILVLGKGKPKEVLKINCGHRLRRAV